MAFKSLDDASARLRETVPLNEDEARSLFQWLGPLAGIFLSRIQMDLALQQIAAINRFNDASGRLTKVAIFVGCAQVFVGAVAVWIALHR
jgi:hypothetical protein